MRGRPKGSTSFAYVSLETLNNLFQNGMPIPVSSVWLKNLNLELESHAVTVKEESPVKNEELEQIEVKEFDFDSEND